MPQISYRMINIRVDAVLLRLSLENSLDANEELNLNALVFDKPQLDHETERKMLQPKHAFACHSLHMLPPFEQLAQTEPRKAQHISLPLVKNRFQLLSLLNVPLSALQTIPSL